MIINFKILLFVLVFLSCLCATYLWIGYIDKTITVGQAYGFTIGDNKIETYRKASGMLKNLEIYDSPIFIDIIVDESNSLLLSTNIDFVVMTQTLLHESGFSRFNDKNKWNFYFHGTYFDSLSLSFCGEKLCEIHRHRKRFELP